VSVSAARDVKEQIRLAIDIVQLVGSSVDLHRRGRVYVGLCPWHDDSRPSLQVDPERQSWKCWVCNIGGDCFSFLMQREGVGFREALEMLAEQAGIALAATSGAARSARRSADEKRALYQAMDWAVGRYQECLLKSPDAQAAREYLDGRGISRATMERFRLGFAPNQWQWLVDRARTTPFSPQVLEAAGLIGRSERSGQFYDRFRGRVIFPIRNTEGQCVAMGGRILPSLADAAAAKYINSPETRLFSKSKHLYGLETIRNAVREQRQVVIVEGYTDALMAWQYGFANVAALLGTAMTAEHIRVLRRYADSITLVLDGDQAGQRRANEILELFIGQQVDLRIVTLPDQLDPCDFLRDRGADAFRETLAGAADALEHRIQLATVGIDLVRDTHRAGQAIEQILATLARVSQLQSEGSTLMRVRLDQILSRLARRFHVEETQLRSRLTSLRGKRPRPPAMSAAKPLGDLVGQLDCIERELLELLTQRPQLVPRAAAEIPSDGLSSPSAQAIYATMLQLVQQGFTADFSRVLSELEEADLKNLLVTLDEHGRQKAASDPELQLEDVLSAFRRRRAKSESQMVLAQLEQSDLDEGKEVDLLEQILNQSRQRQGISAPTDG
jgi:DNA primase